MPAGNTIGLIGDTSSDYDYGTKLNDIFKDNSQLDSEAILAADRAKADYTNVYKKAAEAYASNRKTSKNNFSGRGMLYSGAYAEDQGKLAKDNVDYVDNVTKQSQRFYEDVSRQTAARKAAAEKQRLDIETQQAQAKAQQDLQKSLIEAQTKQYANANASISNSSNSSNNSSNTSVNAEPVAVKVNPLTQDQYNEMGYEQKYWYIYNNQSPEAAAAYAKANGK